MQQVVRVVLQNHLPTALGQSWQTGLQGDHSRQDQEPVPGGQLAAGLADGCQLSIHQQAGVVIVHRTRLP